MVACGVYPDVRSAAEALVSTVSTIESEPELTKLYEERYQQYRKIYPAMKQLFKDLK